MPFFQDELHTSLMQGGKGPFLVGASAGIQAIMVAAAAYLPHYRFNLLFFGPVRIVYIAAIYVALSFIGSVNGEEKNQKYFRKDKVAFKH